jgi:hypothetical protein
VVSLGWSNTFMGSVGSLPFDLTAAGMTGCMLWQSSEMFGLATQFSGPPTASWSLTLPNDSVLMGSRIYAQAFSLAPSANPLQVIASNGIEWSIGNQ